MEGKRRDPVRRLAWFAGGAAAVALILGAAYVVARAAAADTAADDLLAAYESMPATAASLAGEEDPSTAADVPVLMYHNVQPHYPGESAIQKRYAVEPAALEAQLRYLRDNGYTVIPLAALADHLLNGAALPARPVVLTFDDGWVSQYENALPLLEKYGVKATFFVTTHYLGHGRFMSWDQVKDLDARGQTIASHTLTHPFLTRLSDGRLAAEVGESKAELEKFLGKPVDYFAYPFGDLNRRVVAAVQAAGYRAARTTIDGRHQTVGRLHVLRCLEIHSDLDEFIRLLTQ